MELVKFTTLETGKEDSKVLSLDRPSIDAYFKLNNY